MATKDYYKTLGISKTASQEEVKTAFRRLAHQHHPDKGGDADKFKEINEAYQVLGNEKKRKQYDQFGADFANAGSGFDFSGFQSGGFSQGGFSGANINFEDIGDLFGGLGDMFGFSSSRGGRTATKVGQDIEAILVIDFKEAVFGAEKEIIIDKNVKCSKCDGQGAEPGSKVETCSTCKGRGRVIQMQRTIFGAMQAEAVCPDCAGEGKKYSKKCSKCSGQGVHKGQENLRVKIPAGIDEGEAIRLSGRGHSGLQGAASGDLVLRIRISPSKDFIRKNYDIFTKQKINIKQAILGDKISVKTVHGDLFLKIPEGTQSGTVFKMKNKGVPKLRGAGHGDHLVEIIVDIPKNLSRKNKKALEEIDF